MHNNTQWNTMFCSKAKANFCVYTIVQPIRIIIVILITYTCVFVCAKCMTLSSCCHTQVTL